MQAAGIHLDGVFVHRAVVRQTRRNLNVIDLSTQSIPDPQNDVEHPLFANFGASALVSGLHSNDLLIRSRIFTPSRSRKLRQALILQVEAQLHLKAEELITVSVFEAQEKRATTYSTTHSALNEHLETFNRLRLDPERVSAIPAALKAFVKWKESDVSSYFLLDIGLTTTNCIWVENGLLQKAHALASGLQRLKNCFSEERKKLFSINEESPIDFASIKTGQYPVFAEEARTFRREILKLLHSFQCQRPLIFTGEIDQGGFREFLLETLRECVSEEKKIGCTPEEQRYAVSIGLAIDYLVNSKQPLQFRAGASISKLNWQKLGRRSAGLIGASALICTLICGAGAWWMDKRECEIVHNLETWTTEKDPSLRLELFSCGGETTVLVNQWLKLIEKNTKDYRFLMKAPKAARFLNWLTQHPLVESFRLASDPIFFEQIRYQLVSFPHLEAMEDPYLVKVELDFKVNSPLHARKFHEMLLQGLGLVDASRDVSWEVLPDRYRASFYLKNE